MLKAEQVEEAFVAAAHEQNGGPFNWNRVAVLLNEQLADTREKELGDRRLMLADAR